MSARVEITLGQCVGDARAALGLSLQEVAAGAGCSTAYVHKLEQDRVRTPSPRVLAGLARTLGVEYDDVMTAAGYECSATAGSDTVDFAAPRFSNAHVVHLLEGLVSDVAALREEVRAQRIEQ